MGIRAAATGGDGVELQRCGGRLAMVTAPIDPRPRDYAVARLGHRLYAEAQSNQAQGMQVKSGFPEHDPSQIGRTRGGRVDLTF